MGVLVMKLSMIIILFPVFLLLGQTAHAQETTNPLDAFDKPDHPEYVPGQLVITFQSDIDHDEAALILGKHGVSIQNQYSCVTQGYGGPGEEPVEQQNCQQVESWDESQHMAIGLFQQGTEKETARALIEEEGVLFVEPNYVSSAGMDSFGNTVSTPTGGNTPPVSSGIPLHYLLVGILLVAGVLYVVLKKK